MKTAERNLVAITRKNEIEDAHRRFQRQLSKALATRKGPFVVGYPGGSFRTPSVLSAGSIWYAYRASNHTSIKRHWNAFGLADSLSVTASNSISVEVNVALEGAPRRISGLFARDPMTGDEFLLHRGRVGGGQRGVTDACMS